MPEQDEKVEAQGRVDEWRKKIHDQQSPHRRRCRGHGGREKFIWDEG